MTGIAFVNKRYMKGMPFLSKGVYKRIWGETSAGLGGGEPLRINFVEYPPGIIHS